MKKRLLSVASMAALIGLSVSFSSAQAGGGGPGGTEMCYGYVNGILLYGKDKAIIRCVNDDTISSAEEHMAMEVYDLRWETKNMRFVEAALAAIQEGLCVNLEARRPRRHGNPDECESIRVKRGTCFNPS
jgi:hypothetical protein